MTARKPQQATPSQINYIPMDICTSFLTQDIDPDISRAEFSGLTGTQHNALTDALMIRICWMKMN